MDREKLRDIFRKYRAVGLVLLAGLLLLLLPTGKSSGQERQTSDDTQLYSLEETERRMAQLLGRMSGVGRVQVMLSLKTGPTLQLAQDMDLEQEEGSLRQRSQPVTVNRGSGWQEALELKVENQQLQQKIPSMKEKLKDAQERQRLENENRQLKVQVEYLEEDLSWERGISARLQEGIGAVLDFLDRHLPEQFRPLVEKARELLPVPEVQQPEKEQERGHTWGGMEL